MNSEPHALDIWPAALPRAFLGPALRKIKIALEHGNREEAIAAVEQAFRDAQPEAVTLDSPLVELGIPLRLVNSLERDGIMTIRQLCELCTTEVARRPNFGNRNVDAIKIALDRHGWSLRYELSEGSTGLRPIEHRQWLAKQARRTA
jgi:DNA-directed RNA polymerase alpha subunit